MDANQIMLDPGDFAEEISEWPADETYTIKVQKTEDGLKVVGTSPDSKESGEPADSEASDMSKMPMKHKNPAIAILMTTSKK